MLALTAILPSAYLHHSQNGEMSSAQARPPKRDREHEEHKCLSCDYIAGSAAALSRHTKKKCQYPQITRRRDGDLPGCELQPVCAAADEQQQQYDSPAESGLSDSDSAEQGQQEDQDQLDLELPGAAEGVLDSDSDQPSAGDERAAAAATSVDPYQQFADDIVQAAAAAGCPMDAARVWDFVEETRAAAGEAQIFSPAGMFACATAHRVLCSGWRCSAATSTHAVQPSQHTELHCCLFYPALQFSCVAAEADDAAGVDMEDDLFDWLEEPISGALHAEDDDASAAACSKQCPAAMSRPVYLSKCTTDSMH
jgi:hypothetical protein